jgi:hypothetical protein
MGSVGHGQVQDRSAVDPHEAMHIYAERMEKLYGLLRAALGRGQGVREEVPTRLVAGRGPSGRIGEVCDSPRPAGEADGPGGALPLREQQHFITDEQL